MVIYSLNRCFLIMKGFDLVHLLCYYVKYCIRTGEEMFN